MGKDNRISEAVETIVDDIFESEDNKLTMTRDDFKFILESDAVTMPAAYVESYAQIVENNEKYIISETNFTPNIEPFVTRIQPLLRRIVPSLLAFEICGVQPVTVPTTAVFALKADYAGSVNNPISRNVDGARIITLATPLDEPKAIGDAVDFGDGATAVVEYVEDAKTMIVKLDDVTKAPIAGTSQLEGKDVAAVYSNEMAYKKILANYSGPYTTEVGEKLGDDMNQVRINVERMDMTVETRKLKAELTIEIIQDLRAMHGASADSEINAYLETEIKLDLDRAIINKLREVATISPDFKIDESGGRWSLEQYEGLYQRVSSEANKIAKATRRGKGNKLVCSGGVVSAFQSLERFREVETSTNVKIAENPAEVYVGTLKNGIDVYQDWFADDEYALITYKGESNLDAGLIWSPYHLVTLSEVKSYKTFQPALGIMSRFGLTANSLVDAEAGKPGSSSYVRMFNVDFTGTQLGV